MEYALRCNRFREHQENPTPPHLNYRQIRNHMRNTNFQHASYQLKAIFSSPQRPRQAQRTKTNETPLQQLRSRMVDQECDKVTHRTEITYSTELNNRRLNRLAENPKERLNYSLADGSFTPKKRKTHFLTVVSRLPGMSKSKKKTNS